MISVRFDQRVLFVGKTRSGKTFLASRLTAKIPRLLVFDALDRVNMPLATPGQINQFIEGDSLRIKIASVELFNEVVMRTFESGFYTVYVDELYSLVAHPARIPESVSMLWTRGGGNHIGAWACIQRPTRIPLFTITEIEHLFVFRLKNPDDRKRAWDFAGVPPQPDIPKTDPHGFYYLNDFTNEILYVREFEAGV